MFDSLKEIFGNNVDGYFWLILLLSWILVSKIELDKNNTKIKLSLIYIIFFFLALFDIFDLKLLIPIFIVITFIFQEFIFADEFQKMILKKKSYLLLDYFYKMVFEYKMLYFILSIFLLSTYLKSTLSIDSSIIYSLISVLSFLVLCSGIIKTLNNEFKTLDFNQTHEKMINIMSFSKFGCNDKLYDFSNILIYKEDRSFFMRENSYNWLSIEFVIYRLKRIYKECSHYKVCKIKFIGKISNCIIFIFNLILQILNMIIKLLRKFILIFYKVVLCRKNIRYYMRGYSTIEMQLIRTLAVIDGYSSHVFQRKAYEMIYSKIFFSSLRSFYKYHHYINISQYKYYLIYLYIRVAPVRLNKKLYKSILDLYNKKNINEIEIEEFYIWTLGLSHAIIDNSVIYSPIVGIFNMKKRRLKKLVKQFSKD